MRSADNAVPAPSCIACAPDHPHGLHLDFATAPDGSVSASWHPTEAWQGFHGIIHGGIVTTVLDEAMAKAVTARGYALTGELRVRFRRPVAPGADLRVRAWVVERARRLVRAEATLSTSDGAEHAHAWSAFLSPLRKDKGASP
jgi:acyl-coenzyme A thioesterase PaaI-like protein